MAVALVSPQGHVELLHLSRVDVTDLLQGPVHALAVRDSFTLFFTTAAYHLAEVNGFASALANQLIKGDACLVHNEQQLLLDCLLQSKHLRLATPGAAEPASSCSTSSRPTGATATAAGAAAAAVSRSKQHIAAANSARQRILRSMTAIAARSPPAAPQQSAALSGCDCCHSSTQSPALAPAGSIEGVMNPAAEHTSLDLPPQASRRMPAEPHCSSSRAGSSTSTSSTSIPFACTNNSRCSTCSCERAAPRAHPLHQGDGSQAGAAAPGGAATRAGQAPGGTAARRPAPPGMTAQPVASACTPAWQQGRGCARPLPGPATQCSSSAASPPAAAAAAACPAWDDLPVEVIACIARWCGRTVASVMPVCMTCCVWRRAVLEDDGLLGQLRFRLTGPPPRLGMAGWRRAHTCRQFPALLERASKLGNVSALVVSARLLDAAGAPEEAMRRWRRAAKAGHLEGQLVYGLSLYRGSAGVAQDAEDAHLWLSKALKQVQAAKQPNGGSSSSTATSSSSSHCGGGGSAARGGPLPAAAASCVAPPLAGPGTAEREMAALHARVLSQAGLVLGYLAFDGEGTRTDKQEAVRCFKLAVQAGSREAEQVLGWIFNTGQYA